MEHLTIPESYHSPLTIRETEVAIKEIKDQLNEETYDYHKAEELIQRLENPQETFDFTTTSHFISKYTGAEFGSGAEAIKRLLSEVDLDEEYEKTNAEICAIVLAQAYIIKNRFPRP